MRLVLLVTAVLMLAGCSSKETPRDDEGDAAGAPGSNDTPEGEAAAPGDERPVVDIDIVHDFTEGEDETVPFEVPAGTGPVEFRIAFEGDGACVGAGEARMVITTPSGEAYYDGTAHGIVVTGTSCASDQTTRDGMVPEAGTWTAEFSGRAPIRGRVTVTN